MHRSDPALVQACLRGDQRAWDTLVDQYARLIYSIARRYGLVEADAEDVLQNVFVILHRRLESLEDHTRLSAWLITTTHRECWRVGKRAGRYLDLDERFTDLGAPDPDDQLRWERQHLVRLGLDRLGGRCRDLLLALFQQTAPYERIAADLKIAVGSIGPTRARCFRKLEKILVELGLGPVSEAEEDRLAGAGRSGASDS